MAVFEIPLGPSPRRMMIPLGDEVYSLRFAYANAPEGGWFMDIADASENPIVCGVPLVTGIDLLEQYEYLGIPGKLYVRTNGEPAAVPTYNNLGVQSRLYFELNS